MHASTHLKLAAGPMTYRGDCKSGWMRYNASVSCRHCLQLFLVVCWLYQPDSFVRWLAQSALVLRHETHKRRRHGPGLRSWRSSDGLGFDPVDREFDKLGYDVESRVAGTGKLRFIEVTEQGKGRGRGDRYGHEERDTDFPEQA